jgi:hypothetical protein
MSPNDTILRSDALAIEGRLKVWAADAKSESAQQLARDAADIVRQLREALAEARREEVAITLSGRSGDG